MRYIIKNVIQITAFVMFVFYIGTYTNQAW